MIKKKIKIIDRFIYITNEGPRTFMKNTINFKFSILYLINGLLN